MKKSLVVGALLPLLMAACSDPPETPKVAENAGPAEVQPESVQDRLQREGREWAQQSKELGSAAWDATKEKSAEYSEKAGEYYEDAKVKSQGYYQSAKREGAELYEDAKREGTQLYEQAKEKGAEIYEGAKEDMEDREGHPPVMEPAR